MDEFCAAVETVRLGGHGDWGGPCKPPQSSTPVLSISAGALGTATAWAAAVTRTAALRLALALALALAVGLAVGLALAPVVALTLTGTRAAVDTRAAICFLAGLLAGGAFFVSLRRTAVSSAAAIGAALGQCSACGQ